MMGHTPAMRRACVIHLHFAACLAARAAAVACVWITRGGTDVPELNGPWGNKQNTITRPSFGPPSRTDDGSNSLRYSPKHATIPKAKRPASSIVSGERPRCAMKWVILVFPTRERDYRF